MKNGYNIFWTNHALNELADLTEYLETNWTDRDLKKFAKKLDNTLSLISQNPDLFQNSGAENVKRAVVTKHNTLYYRVMNETIEILSLFSNFKSPDKRKI